MCGKYYCWDIHFIDQSGTVKIECKYFDSLSLQMQETILQKELDAMQETMERKHGCCENWDCSWCH